MTLLDTITIVISAINVSLLTFAIFSYIFSWERYLRKIKYLEPYFLTLIYANWKEIYNNIFAFTLVNSVPYLNLVTFFPLLVIFVIAAISIKFLSYITYLRDKRTYEYKYKK